MPAWMLKCKKVCYPQEQLRQRFYLVQVPAEDPNLGRILYHSSQEVLEFEAMVNLHFSLLRVARLPVDHPMQFITKDWRLPFPGSTSEK
jgi:hypothetical protein